MTLKTSVSSSGGAYVVLRVNFSITSSGFAYTGSTVSTGNKPWYVLFTVGYSGYDSTYTMMTPTAPENIACYGKITLTTTIPKGYIIQDVISNIFIDEDLSDFSSLASYDALTISSITAGSAENLTTTIPSTYNDTDYTVSIGVLPYITLTNSSGTSPISSTDTITFAFYYYALALNVGSTIEIG